MHSVVGLSGDDTCNCGHHLICVVTRATREVLVTQASVQVKPRCSGTPPRMTPQLDSRSWYYVESVECREVVVVVGCVVVAWPCAEVPCLEVSCKIHRHCGIRTLSPRAMVSASLVP